jgi:LPXTG-site transpeptidase (sortase) family protein
MQNEKYRELRKRYPLYVSKEQLYVICRISKRSAKYAGHFPDSSSWLGNICIAGHNRGSKHNIGSIKNLKPGNIITYGTALGTKRYAVTFSGIVASTDISYLAATRNNRITLITCLSDKPALRVCVQAAEI